MHNTISRWGLSFTSSVILLIISTAVYAQRIPDVVVWSVGAGLLAPIIAVPVKLGVVRLFDLAIRPSKLWLLCLMEWLLWFPVGFVVVVSFGWMVFGLFALLGLSAWLHRPTTSKRTGFAKYAIGLLLALPAPLLALLIFGSVLLSPILGES